MVINHPSGLRDFLIGYRSCIYEGDIAGSKVYIKGTTKRWTDKELEDTEVDFDNEDSVLLDFYSLDSIEKLIYILEQIKEKYYV